MVLRVERQRGVGMEREGAEGGERERQRHRECGGEGGEIWVEEVEREGRGGGERQTETEGGGVERDRDGGGYGEKQMDGGGGETDRQTMRGWGGGGERDGDREEGGWREGWGGERHRERGWGCREKEGKIEFHVPFVPWIKPSLPPNPLPSPPHSPPHSTPISPLPTSTTEPSYVHVWCTGSDTPKWTG